MYLIFVLNRQNVLPYEDVAFLHGYKWVYKTDDITPEFIKKNVKSGAHIHQLRPDFLSGVGYGNDKRRVSLI